VFLVRGGFELVEGSFAREIHGDARAINNMRIIYLLSDATGAGDAATSSMEFYAFHDYYSKLLHLFINVTGALNRVDAENVRAAFECYEVLEEDCRVRKGARSYENKRRLLTLLEGINEMINTGLIRIGFFFKMSSFEPKGLDTGGDFGTKSIFGSKKKKKKEGGE